MKNGIYDENNGLWYEKQGNYILPILNIADKKEYHIGIWGQRYCRHLKTNHRILYCNYLTAGTLNRHISEVDKRAKAMFKRLVKQLAEKENVTEKLKADAPMEWIRRMNNIRSRAEEIVNVEVIYI